MLETNRALQDMLGYSAEELSQMHDAELTHPDDVDEDVGQRQRLLRGELDSYRLEKRYLRRDGEVLWADSRVLLARDADGRTGFGVAMTEDITARKQLENQLRHSQKMEAVGSLAGGVAHDFNNVLLAIGGYCELLLADPGQLDQVVLNLTLNVRDAMPEGGELSISAGVAILEPHAAEAIGARPGRHCFVSVSDTGVGMDAETQSRVFEPFFTTKPSGEGTGLWLSTVYGIVAQSGGAVSVESAPGCGSVLIVYLPERLDPVRQAVAPAHARSVAV